MFEKSIAQQFNQAGRDKTVLTELQTKYLNSGKSLFTINNIDFIYQECPALFYKIISLIDLKHQLHAEVNSLPTMLHKLTIYNLLETEIMQTNNLANITINQNVVRKILNQSTDLYKYKERQLVDQYLNIIDHKTEIGATTDISNLHFDLLSNFIDNQDHAQIGQQFRTETVEVLSTSKQVIHTGVEGADQINHALNTVLDYFTDSTDNIFIKIACFHYIFGYIHPFYDGNGRIARYITSAHLYPEISIASLNLSNHIAINQNLYNTMFEETNSRFNVGDLTYFIYNFLEMIEQAVLDTLDQVTDTVEKNNQFEILLTENMIDPKQSKYLMTIYQASLVAETLPTSQIANIHGVSIPTALSAMKELAKLDYISMIKIGKSNHAVINPDIVNILNKELEVRHSLFADFL